MTQFESVIQTIITWATHNPIVSSIISIFVIGFFAKLILEEFLG